MKLGINCIWAGILMVSFAMAADENLATAIQQNNLNAVKRLLKAGSDVNASDEAGITPLMNAAIYSGARSMNELLKRGANPNAISNQGATALIWAAGDLEKVELLLEAGANPNVRSKAGRTALSVASAQAGAHRAVESLLAHGADVNAVDADGIPVISYAGASGDADTIRALLAKGARANTYGPVTPLSMAAASGNLEAMRVLLDAGADPNPKKMFLSPLQTAIVREDSEAINLLLQHGAEPDVRGVSAGTPLMWAAYSERGDASTAEALLKRGADPHTRIHGEDALTWALRRGETRVVERLQQALKEGSEVANEQ